MSRALLISLLCSTLVLMGVTGVHAHVPAPVMPTSHSLHEHHGAYVTSILDTDHESDHEEDGDFDIEPSVKAFGKTTLTASIAIVSTLVLILVTTGEIGSLRIPVSPPLRPPESASRFFLLPPSHAPPASLH